MPATRHHAEAFLRVRYAETDQMGVVYHANYLVWFEVARVELLRTLGIPYQRLETEFNTSIAVAGVEVRYRVPARYDEEIAIRTRLLVLRGSVMKIGYEVVRTTDEVLLCEGTTTHVVVNRRMERSSLPGEYESALQGLLKRS